LSKGWDGFKILDESKKKSKNLHSNTMKVSFSNKSLVKKVKSPWKPDEVPRLKKSNSKEIEIQKYLEEKFGE